MFNITYTTRNCGVTKTLVDATTEYAARKAVSTRADFDAILSCEKAFAKSRPGATTTVDIAATAETLRAALKQQYGDEFSMVVFGNGALIAAASFTYGTVIATATD